MRNLGDAERHFDATERADERQVVDVTEMADPENAAAKSDEARLIQQEMRRELALQILRRLQVAQL